MGFVEDSILRHPCRGMDILRPCLAEDFCASAAEKIREWTRGTVLLTTGFYVAGHAETDGPPGTLLLARALDALGFRPVVVTDELCRGYFEAGGISCVYLANDADEAACSALLTELAPVGMISVERCGKNARGEYANMRGVSITEFTAPVDQLFAMAAVPTVAVGDGGNEIGMGNLAEVISEKLDLDPCVVRVDDLVIATVSNWGALGLCACLGQLPDEQRMMDAYHLAQELGFVDGVTRECVLSEDGFQLETIRQLRKELEGIVMKVPVGC